MAIIQKLHLHVKPSGISVGTVPSNQTMSQEIDKAALATSNIDIHQKNAKEKLKKIAILQSLTNSYHNQIIHVHTCTCTCMYIHV